MRVVVGHRGHAETEELVLHVLRGDARRTRAIELDAARAGEQIDGLPDAVGREIVAHLHQAADGAIEHLAGNAGHRLVGPHVAVHERHALGDALRQADLEFPVPAATDRLAKARDRRLAHVGALGEFVHRQVDDFARRVEHVGRELALGRTQLGQRGFNSVQHGRHQQKQARETLERRHAPFPRFAVRSSAVWARGGSGVWRPL